MANVKLSVKDLTVSFRTGQGMVRAVRSISFDVYEGETLAIVGESGSGKSVTSRAIMGILAGNAVVDKGSIIYEGQDLVQIPEEDFHKIRGKKIGMIFQDPLSSLNPIMRIGKQITESMIINGKRLKNQYKELIHNEKTAVVNIKKNKAKNLKQLKHEVEEIKLSENIDRIKIAQLKTEYRAKQRALSVQLPALRSALWARRGVARSIIRSRYQEEKNRIQNLIEPLQLRLKDASDEERKDLRKKISDYRESLRRFVKVTHKEAKERALKVMNEVGIPDPERRFRQYPFQFSGGMRQRIVIAIALTADPDVLICDEPTTALDVTIQAQILDLIKNLKTERNLTVIFITHDLGVVANMSDRVAVMYAGKIVEIGLSEEVFYTPRHPYTWALLSSMPDLNSKDRLTAIPGTPPNMLFPPKGDAFADRNAYAMKIDFEQEPPYFRISDTHYAATWLLHPDAPKVEMPTIISERIESMSKASEERIQSMSKASDARKGVKS
jgi:oligopeptide transport system ATP-binding protein